MSETNSERLRFGSEDLRLPDEIRGTLRAHIEDLRAKYRQRGWGGRVGFGDRPALIVIDLGRYWLDPDIHIGSNLDPIVEATYRILGAARQAQIPIFFTTWDYDPAHPPTPQNAKLRWQVPSDQIEELFALDPRMERRASEKLVATMMKQQ